ncbi:MAG: hypothetical protein EXS49_02005 [Candidatus Pacebacteria bacterium]|nr:hypothetical protein [Candidatus Paceibacterota bacterium]
MKNGSLKIFSLIIVLGLLLIPKTSNGAFSDPQMIITWKADSFIPHWYKGRAMPIRNSNIKTSLVMVDNGKIIDLSQYEIRWNGDNGIFEKGIGFVNFSFELDKLISQPQNLTATIVGYNGENIKKTITIPVLKPEIGLETNLNRILIEKGGKATLRALPFFFNINNESSINIKWTVNGKILTKESGEKLVELTVPKFRNERFAIDLLAENRYQELEIASETKYFNSNN